MKERGLFGTSILIVEPGLIGTASRDVFSKVGWALSMGPWGEIGQRPSRAAIPSLADCDLSLTGAEGLPSNRFEV